jgi:GNAT superfamily N-acetyltransferase
MNPLDVVYRAGTSADLTTVVSLKLRMFEELGVVDAQLVNEPAIAIQREYERLFAVGDLQHFVAVEDGQVVACAVAILKRDPPFCFFRPPFYGFLADVYTVPENRRRGHAKRLTQEALSWLRQKGVERITLLSSELARPMYEEFGFHASGELVLRV